jgi:hypothetical protein
MLRSFVQAAILVAVLWLGQHYWPWRELRHGAGVITAPVEPVQTTVAPYSVGAMGEYELTAMAEYAITARVLNTRRYRFEDGHDLAPIDIAVGWGRMSDEAIIDQLDISQSNRFYFYQWEGRPPLPPSEIISHSANMHLIPCNREVERALFALRRGSLVHLEGELVNARSKKGRTWRTSLSRTDTGAGACELMYVDSATLVSLPAESSTASSPLATK